MDDPGLTVNFVKMNGAGNDFVLVDNRSGNLPIEWSEFSRFVCSRRYGVGADGVLVLENSSRGEFKMSYFNSDGSYGGMCGNGGRCAALFLMTEKKLNDVSFEALGHLYRAIRTDANVTLYMKAPSSFGTTVISNAPEESLRVYSIDTGAPHGMIFLDELTPQIRAKLETNGIVEIGRFIRYDRRFAPHGTNVNFVEILGANQLSMRTYERGVEAETLACGTGAVACAIASVVLRGLSPPINVRTRSGEVLSVLFERGENDQISNVRLEGSARIIYTGEVYYPGYTRGDIHHTSS